MREQALPWLTSSTLESLDVFPERDVLITAELVDRYTAITGDDRAEYRRRDRPQVPLGLHPMLARLAYLENYRMPPGGVMLGQTLAFYRHLVIGHPVTLQARVDTVDTSGRSPFVRLVTTAANRAGQLAARVTIEARWPRAEVAA